MKRRQSRSDKSSVNDITSGAHVNILSPRDTHPPNPETNPGLGIT